MADKSVHVTLWEKVLKFTVFAAQLSLCCGARTVDDSPSQICPLYLPAATAWPVPLCLCVIMAKCGDNYCSRKYHRSGFEYFARCYMSVCLSVDRFCQHSSVKTSQDAVTKLSERVVEIKMKYSCVRTSTCWQASQLVWSHPKMVSSFFCMYSFVQYVLLPEC